MYQLPPIIQRTAQHDVDTALQWTDSTTERIAVLVAGGHRTDAVDVAQAALRGQEVDNVVYEGDQLHVHCGPFHGTHGIRRSRFDSDPSPTTIGSYIHEPTGFEFEAEAPDQQALHDELRDAVSREPAGEAAKAAYRRSRL